MTPSQKLRQLLADPELLLMPGCYDGLSAKLAQQAGFAAAFMSGFAVSGARLGQPDTGLISFGEMRNQLQDIVAAAPGLVVLADGDTGYGNAINAQRTVREYARAGAACVMIEDQVSPKRCGHTKGKDVVSRGEARMRIRAAVEAARDHDVLILARTDARAVHGLSDAIERCQIFAEEGADIIFLEAPLSVDEMREACRNVERPMLANMVIGGKTPILSKAELTDIGYRCAVYPLVPFAAAIGAIRGALESLRRDDRDALATAPDFADVRAVVGFPDYYAIEERFVEP
jgi:2-methylisocitrate lyase-like PEP mutase family enzyme